MRRNPIYVFKDEDQTGIYDVPLKSTIHILNGGVYNNNNPTFVEIQSKDGLHGNSTIKEFLANPKLYIDLLIAASKASELERIVEYENQGWRLLEEDPKGHLNIGERALDLTHGTQMNATTISGASGDYSFAVGKYSQAIADGSIVLGEGLLARNNNLVVLGTYNQGHMPDANVAAGIGESIFEVGIGKDDFNRRNGLEVYLDGYCRAPVMDYAMVEAGDPHTLVVKEYADIIDGGYIPTNNNRPR